MRAPGELTEHAYGVVAIGGLPVDAPVEENRRIDAERDPSIRVNRARLPLRMSANELDRVGVWRVVLDVVGREDLERDAQLLEDRASLRRRRREGQSRLRATHRSSLGHLRAQSAVVVS